MYVWKNGDTVPSTPILATKSKVVSFTLRPFYFCGNNLRYLLNKRDGRPPEEV
jgi:hypothetical protein